MNEMRRSEQKTREATPKSPVLNALSHHNALASVIAHAGDSSKAECHAVHGCGKCRRVTCVGSAQVSNKSTGSTSSPDTGSAWRTFYF